MPPPLRHEHFAGGGAEDSVGAIEQRPGGRPILITGNARLPCPSADFARRRHTADGVVEGIGYEEIGSVQSEACRTIETRISAGPIRHPTQPGAPGQGADLTRRIDSAERVIPGVGHDQIAHRIEGETVRRAKLRFEGGPIGAAA